VNFYRRFPGDYLAKTQHLTVLEHGIYTLLLDTMYATEKPIQSREVAYRVCRVPENPLGFKRAETNGVLFADNLPQNHSCTASDVDKILDYFFILTKKGFINARFEKELNHMESRVNAARENGRMGGRPKKPTRLRVGYARQNPGKTSPEARSQKSEVAQTAPLVIPDWIPLQEWNDYIEMRQRIRKPATTQAMRLVINRLEKLWDQGDNPKAVLEQSIMQSWQGVFPVSNGNGNGRNGNGRPSPDQRAERNSKYLGLADPKVTIRTR
jgi:uncharacterized protein YdaU (DUF1376 family)